MFNIAGKARGIYQDGIYKNPVIANTAMSLDRIINRLPKYLNIRKLADLEVTLTKRLSGDIKREGEVYRHLYFEIDYPGADPYLPDKYMRIKVSQTSIIAYNPRYDFRMDIDDNNPGLPRRQGLGMTLLWLVLVKDKSWEGRQIVIGDAQSDSRKMAKRMKDFAPFEFAVDKGLDKASVVLTIPRLTAYQRKAVDAFFKDYMKYEEMENGDK